MTEAGRGCSLIDSSYLFHFSTLPLTCCTGDFDSDGALLSLPPQSHAVWLQGAEGDLQLWPREAARSPVFCGDFRRVQD